ncbi:MAG TPA: hypothetical protein VH084_28435 [Mycobacterium sp.]|nr:hypothetical protein [Mycobacterium sp.]
MSSHKPWALIKAERLIRSGRIPLDDMRSYGAALTLFLAEYDRLKEQEQDMILLIDEHARLKMVEETLRTLINLRRNPGNVKGEAVTSWVTIDNSRRTPNGTYADLSDCNGPIAIGDVVHVIERESCLTGGALVTGIDEEFVYLSLAWHTLTDAYTNRKRPAQ